MVLYHQPLYMYLKQAPEEREKNEIEKEMCQKYSQWKLVLSLHGSQDDAGASIALWESG